MAPKNPKDRPTPPPSWQREGRALVELRAFSATEAMEASVLDRDGNAREDVLEAIADTMADLPEEARELYRDRREQALLLTLDALRRGIERTNDHLASIRTGTRLNHDLLVEIRDGGGTAASVDEVEEIEAVETEGAEEGGAEEGEDIGGDAFDGVETDAPIQIEGDAGGFSEEEAAAAFAALDAAPGGAAVPGDAPGAKKAPAPRKTPAPRKAQATAQGKAPSNGAPTKPVPAGVTPEVFDADGRPVQ